MISPQQIQVIDALLPQTQCGKCGHPGCRPYAEGIAAGEPINKCPPGGEATVAALAELLKRPILPLELPAVPAQIAIIREAECIGCTKCIQACPVDAIFGAAKLMHTVISNECTGCELCVAPCPVDCIDIVVLPEAQALAQRQQADQFRARHETRLARLAREEAARQAQRQTRQSSQPATTLDSQVSLANDETVKRLKIATAMAKVALSKVQKQFEIHGTDALAQQVSQLQRAYDDSQQQLELAQAARPSISNEGLAALKQAKIALAMRRAELGKAERQGLDEASLAPLKAALAQAEHALHSAEDASGKPQPVLQRTYKVAVDTRLRELKTELAYAKADLLKLQRRQISDPATLEQARQRLARAEQQLHDYQP